LPVEYLYLPERDRVLTSRSSLMSRETVAWVTSKPSSRRWRSSSSWVSMSCSLMCSKILAWRPVFMVHLSFPKNLGLIDLLVEPVVKIRDGQSQEPGGPPGAGEHQPVPGPQLHRLLPVYGEEQPPQVFGDVHGKAGVPAEDNAAVEQGVGTDGGVEE